MTDEAVEVGVRYRTGPAGATVRLANGAERHLPPGRLFEFQQLGKVTAGELTRVTTSEKQRTGYSDKQRRRRRDYTDKSRRA